MYASRQVNGIPGQKPFRAGISGKNSMPFDSANNGMVNANTIEEKMVTLHHQKRE